MTVGKFRVLWKRGDQFEIQDWESPSCKFALGKLKDMLANGVDSQPVAIVKIVHEFGPDPAKELLEPDKNPEMHCVKCGHKWYRRNFNRKPIMCPKCKSVRYAEE